MKAVKTAGGDVNNADTLRAAMIGEVDFFGATGRMKLDPVTADRDRQIHIKLHYPKDQEPIFSFSFMHARTAMQLHIGIWPAVRLVRASRHQKKC